MGLFKTSAVIVFMMMLMIGCAGKDKKTDDKENSETAGNDIGPAGKLNGVWEIKRAEGDMASMNEGTTYEFNGEKLLLGKAGFVNPGKTEITDTTFSFQADDNNYKFMYEYHFNGDTLVVKMQGGGDQVFYMVKK